MDVIKVSPRGYCYGVVDAMEIARRAAKDASFPRPIYIIGLIVHNRFAVEELSHSASPPSTAPTAPRSSNRYRRHRHLHRARRFSLVKSAPASVACM